MTLPQSVLLEHYHTMETAGLLDSLSARAEAKSAANAIRYGQDLKDYFGSRICHPRMIVHPYRPDLNGKDLFAFRDSVGKAVFVDFVKAVDLEGEGYVDYMWQWNDDSALALCRNSHMSGSFEPWRRAAGTGIYIEDVRD
ncbi:MAG: cache domain-containing protein [Marinilabiliales bacterium]|nr:cache domain-containing protein [Marinilabiliales bacterium]